MNKMQASIITYNIQARTQRQEEKTIPKFTDRLFLQIGYIALLPSGPNREQLKSKAMYKWPNSNPTGVGQHRDDAF